MPNFWDPDERTTITFRPDASRPEDRRRRIECRFITVRQRRRIDALLAGAADAAKPNEEQDAILREALSIGIIGPVGAVDPDDGKPLPKSLDSLEAIFSEAELWLMARFYPDWIFNSEVDPKKSPSPSPSGPASSAETVAAASA